MCNNGNCSWIWIIIILLFFCGGWGNSNTWNNDGCGCNSGCGC